MSVKIVATVTAKPEFRDEVLGLLQDAVAPSRREAGNISYDLHRDLQNGNRFVFIEQWQDQAAIERHKDSPHFQTLVAGIEGKVEGLDIVLLEALA